MLPGMSNITKGNKSLKSTQKGVLAKCCSKTPTFSVLLAASCNCHLGESCVSIKLITRRTACLQVPRGDLCVDSDPSGTRAYEHIDTALAHGWYPTTVRYIAY